MPGTMPAVVAKELDEAINRGLRVVFMDFAPEDAAIHQRVCAHMEHAREAVFFGCAYDAELSIGVLSRARLVLAMRLHGSILANAFGIPSIGLNYNDKIEALYHQMGYGKLLLSLGCTAEDLAATFGCVESGYEEIKTDLLVKAQHNRVLANEAFDEVYALVDACEPAPRAQHLYRTCESSEAVALRRAKKERDSARSEKKKAERENAALRKELERVKGSTTWKAGRLMTAIPRAIRRASRL